MHTLLLGACVRSQAASGVSGRTLTDANHVVCDLLLLGFVRTIVCEHHGMSAMVHASDAWLELHLAKEVAGRDDPPVTAG